MRWFPVGSMVLVSLLVVGCDDGGPGKTKGDPPSPSSGDATWAEVEPILAEKCGACHVDGGIGPFAVDYATTRLIGPEVVDAIESGRMPPWQARETDECNQPVWFADDPRVTADELKTIKDWVAADTPAAPLGTEPHPPRPADTIEDPNERLTIAEPFAIEGTQDIYQCFRIEVPSGDENVWLTEVEVAPDNGAVVHHVLVWADPEDQSANKVGPDGSYPCSGEPDVWPTELISAWAPGGPVMRTPPNTGVLFKPGTSIVVNIHYHPTGEAETAFDQSGINLKWTKQQPAEHVTWFLVDLPFGARSDGDFNIPAGASEHTEVVTFHTESWLPFDLPIFAIAPHMHFRGTEMQVNIRRDEPADDTCLVHAKDYRFDFQTSYVYDAERHELPKVEPGDRVEVKCTYDNSWDNPYMADALEASGDDDLISVGWGEETGDEMCMAMVGLILPPIDIGDFLF